MRQIKFRFYDRKTNKMLNVEGIDFKFNRIITNYKITNIQCKGDVIEYTQECHDISHQNDLMQFTGLQDKNGNDIYEGDIITISNPLKERSFTTVIIYDEYKFNGKDFYFTHFYIPSDLFSEGTEYIEIIGNIHENPKLLEHK